MAFHATKRSIKISEGRKSCGAMFFLINDCERESVEPCLLALDNDVAREIETVSLFMTEVK